MSGKALLSALVISSFYLAEAAAEERELNKNDVPKAVLEAFERVHPEAKAVEYEEKTRGGMPFYELEYKVQGKEREFIYSADGTLVEQHEEIDRKDLPEVISQAVKKERPQATIKEVERITKSGETIIGYEVEIKDGQQEIELEFDPTGKPLKQEQD
ncbi:PepSY-like domain-containing protein [Methylocaldum sp.]|uniref:PepSY-like domain-containing protein n=1 Tax=Methylocaldum sp. TaxID=1969727 RepID=UPI002D3ABD79|nr:PepSY-like domain-containing protein [Methylocaldum sp.]HYE35194.1 PepSY-like domain-containing protein [Methylocaldum sp.]